MYSVNDSKDPTGIRVRNLFSTRDENYHSTLIRPVRNLYTMTKLQEMEPLIDETINLFCDILMERFAVPGKACEMTDYILYCMLKLCGVYSLTTLVLLFLPLYCFYPLISELMNFSRVLGHDEQSCLLQDHGCPRSGE